MKCFMNDEDFIEKEFYGVMYYFRYKDMFFNISLIMNKYNKTLEQLLPRKNI